MAYPIKLVTLWLASTILMSCSVLDFTSYNSSTVSPEPLCANDQGEFYPCQDMPTHMSAQTIDAQPPANLFNTDVHFQLLTEYTEQMASDIQHDMQGRDIDGPIVVTAFVDMDAPQHSSNRLGDQLAEAFINDLQQIGLPVSDYNLTGMLNMDKHSGYLHPRDIASISADMDINYVLSGTMLRNERGVVVNVRLINYTTKQVVASNSKLLPNFLIDKLM